MKIRTAIIEDVKKTRTSLKLILSECCPQVEIVGEADSVSKGYELILKSQPDLAILDIDINEGTTFDMLRMLQRDTELDMKLIFLTGHDDSQNTVKAFRFSASDYLVKPLDRTLIQETVDKISMEIVEKRDNRQRMSLLLELINNPFTQEQQIQIQGLRSEYQFCKIKEILYLESENPITHFYLENGRKILGIKNIGYYSNSLCDELGFFQISQSLTINLSYLRTYAHRNLTLTLADGTELIASRKGGRNLREYLKNHEPKKVKIENWQDLLRSMGFIL